ncbi:MAG: site-specific integrase [Bacteroidaceae bacterium]|nr:site-specific integrase [Bacteroidaceae bacterium]
MKKENHFLAFAFAEAERMRQLGHPGVAANYACSARSLQRFLHTMGKHDITFDQMKPATMANFERWLHDQGICRNTSSAYLRCLHAVFKKAVQLELACGDPFLGTYRGVAKTAKRAIPAMDIRRIGQLDIRRRLLAQGRQDGTLRFHSLLKRLELARDIFIFSFCARGLSFVDLAYLQKSNICHGSIRYARRKTGRRLEVRIEQPMQHIIDRWATDSPYLFPIITETCNAERIYRQYHNGIQLYNKHLKLLGKLLGGLPLTSYVSRHSWASTAHQQHVPLSIISQAMGHDSEQTTEIYLKSLECNMIDQANHRLLRDVFRP